MKKRSSFILSTKQFSRCLAFITMLMIFVTLMSACGNKDENDNKVIATEPTIYDVTEPTIDDDQEPSLVETPKVATEAPSETVGEDYDVSSGGSEQRWEDINIFVPNCMEMEIDSTQHILFLKDKNKEHHSIMIIPWLDEQGAKSNVEVETNTRLDKHPESISFVAGAEWTGMTYNDEGVIKSKIYATVGEQTYYVGVDGYSYDSDIVTAVLESLSNN